MKPRIGRISVSAASCIFCISAALSPIYCQESFVTLDQKVTDLEKRVARLESLAASRGASSASASTVQPVYTGAPSPLLATLMSKKLVGENGNQQFGFLFQFRNNGQKDVTSFGGDIIMRSLNAQQLLDFEIGVSQKIPAGSNATWYGGISYDTKDANQRTVAGTDKSYLVVEFKPDTIMFSDGTMQVYSTKK
jgi:hypothetical protein